MKKPRFSRDTLKFPQKNFDMVKEGVISLAISGVLIIGVAAIWGAPYRPAITNQQVANKQPVLIEQTALGDLAGTGDIATYGPPYNTGTQGVQSLGGFSPQTWWGTPYQVNTAEADVLTPLSMLAKAANNSQLTTALTNYQAASSTQQQTWNANYAKALKTATVSNGEVVVKSGDYGPVATLMNDELTLAQSGLLSGALNRQTNNGVYRWNVQNNLLFLQGDALHQAAQKLNMLGEQWGINHDEQAYPGPWWLTPYTFLYQVPPWSTIAAGDQAAAYTMGLLFLLLLLVPFIPGLNKLPRLLPIHKFIWRDWYQRMKKDNSCATCLLKAQCSQEFKGRAATSAAIAVTSGQQLGCYVPVGAKA
jgi:hypothetical protein